MGWLLRLVAAVYQLYYLVVRGAPAARVATEWARSRLHILQPFGMALVVVLGWGAGQAHLRRVHARIFR